MKSPEADSTPVAFLNVNLIPDLNCAELFSQREFSNTPYEMHLFFTLLWALVAPKLIAATALTYRLSPSETACFFASVDTAGSKIAFYFAVRGHLGAFP